MLKEKAPVKNGELLVSKPVFLIGFFRSGTSLLHAILNQHSQIALMYECNAWDFPDILSRKRLRHNWLERLEFINRALSRHRLIFGASQRGLENVRDPEDLYRTFAESKQAIFWGEKSPVYCARLKKLLRHHPGCSFIVIWRDPLEIFRSIVRASSNAPFFSRPGTLSRFIYSQEQMIRQTSDLIRAGGRVHYATYDDLVDKTEETCRGICRFLSLEFDEKMLDLDRADYSLVFPLSAQHHQHLRRGVIQRQQFSEEILPLPVAGILRRFRNRWNRIRNEEAGIPTMDDGKGEPSLIERLYHAAAGLFFYTMDAAKRVLLEFLPLTWLRTYRQTKKWLLARRAELPADRRSFGEQFRAHWITILASAVFMAIVAYVDIFTGPDVTLLPFYLIPCAALTLVVNYRWGTFAAATFMVIWSAIQAHQNPNLNLEHWETLLWDAGMRFILLEIVVLLLNRVRIEAAQAGESI